MPVTHTFDDRIVVMQMIGEYETDELKARIASALDDPRCPAAPVLMFDLRASESLQHRSPSDVRDMAQFLAARAGRINHRLAMVVATDLQFGLMRMGSVIAEQGGLPGEVFRDYDAARRWLLTGSAGPEPEAPPGGGRSGS
jgi:hypothetical protein